MIAPDWRLSQMLASGLITPKNSAQAHECSIDMVLGDEFVFLVPEAYFCPDTNMLMERPKEIHVKSERVRMRKGDFVLATTAGTIKVPTDCVGFVYLRSSAARAGLEHLHAGLLEPGFEGQITLEFTANAPLILEAGRSYIQVVIFKMEGRADGSYASRGSYQGQVGVTPSVWSVKNGS